MRKKILIVDDEVDIAELVRLHLEDAGAHIQLSHEGKHALALAESGQFDLLVLDLSLPGMDGLEICRRVRRRNACIPILLLTARTSQADRILGLEMGADDYLGKPFNVLELVARVRALFRRVDALAAAGAPATTIVFDGLRIDVARREAEVDGRPVTLTEKEFDLLLHFSRAPGRVYSREQLLEALWGTTYSGYDHTVNSHINRLRAKIEVDRNNPKYIKTVWGVGYKLAGQGGQREP